MINLDPVLNDFKAALGEIYGDRLGRVVLLGSRARGDARPDSDYDIAVFLNDYSDRWEEAYKIADVASKILRDRGVFIDSLPYRLEQYNEQTGLMHEIRREGYDL